MKIFFKHQFTGFLLALFLAGCAPGSLLGPSLTPTSTHTATASATMTASATPTLTPSSTPTSTPTITRTPTVTSTPTITLTPTITPTPTRDYPDVTVKMQANCRYGAGVAYLYRWGLYPGDKADVRGKNASGTWFWIHPYNLENANCWASEIVFEEIIDKALVPVVQVELPKTTFAGPPGDVTAVREGNQVRVSWSPVVLSEDKTRGYLLEITLCQDGNLFFRAYGTLDNSYTFRDDPGCAYPSGGLLYTAEKHGYSDPVKIPWP